MEDPEVTERHTDNESTADAVKERRTNMMGISKDKEWVIEESNSSVTLSAPGHQRFRLALCHTLHHSGAAEHHRGILRWCNYHNSIQGFSWAYNNKRNAYISILAIQLLLETDELTVWIHRPKYWPMTSSRTIRLSELLRLSTITFPNIQPQQPNSTVKETEGEVLRYFYPSIHYLCRFIF